MSISESEAFELLEDRIKFKLYFAEKHYVKILEFQQTEGINFLRSSTSRLRFEDELEALLAHLIRARDALLIRIRDILKIPLKDKDVHLSEIGKKLSGTKYRWLLCEM